ncbi:MAG: CoA-disulfide reductase [Acidobacteria bacterium]|nr:MAG: CoA-disulfide reductase [Acidobacteriota bacterium]
MKLLIVGGVAAGASAAARARRLDENAEIILFERGQFISFANCGLPYHIGKVIPNRRQLLIMPAAAFRARNRVDVRTLHEVTAVNRAEKKVSVRNLNTGESHLETYDKLVLATGASPIRPSIPGADDPDVMQLWTIGDMDRIIARVERGAKKCVVVGGGFVGLEVAENLRELGLEVTIVEMLPQVLPTLDYEMAQPLAQELRRAGVNLALNRRVVEIHRASTEEEIDSDLHVVLDDETELEAKFVVMSVGVRPNSELAEAAGLELSARKGVIVNQYLQTSDPDIYAVGDAIAVRDLVTDDLAQIPLAGPANRQGRIAADNIMGRQRVYRGTLGTSVVKLFSKTAGSAGVTERRLRAAGQAYQKVYLHPYDHATYYPGAKQMAMKLLFGPEGKILGIQAVGEKGVDKRVDVVATAMLAGMTVFQLEDLELSYAPPYGAARDPVNVAGMLAANVLRGDTSPVYPDSLPDGAFVLDVREPSEVAEGTIPGSQMIPLGQLRARLNELPRDKKIVTSCRVGLRGYLAERILRQNGFNAANLSGGLNTWKLYHGT